MNDTERLYRAVLEQPADADLRRVFADALEDAGLPDLAAKQRRAASAEVKRIESS